VTHLEVVGTQPVLRISGEIDLATLPSVRSDLVRAISTYPRVRIAVDLDGVTALDDAGLGILLGAAARARDSGGDLVLVCTTPALVARLERTGASRAIDVVDRIEG